MGHFSLGSLLVSAYYQSFQGGRMWFFFTEDVTGPHLTPTGNGSGVVDDVM
jgi:hypothetical protein